VILTVLLYFRDHDVVVSGKAQANQITLGDMLEYHEINSFVLSPRGCKYLFAIRISKICPVSRIRRLHRLFHLFTHRGGAPVGRLVGKIHLSIKS